MLSRSVTVRSFATLPVLRVEAGSNSRTSASSSATGRCSTPRGDDELAGRDLRLAVRQLHPKRAADDEEQRIGVIVMMPDELALEPGKLDLLAVQLTHETGTPVIGEQGEFLGKVDNFYHGAPSA